MGFNSAFKGLKSTMEINNYVVIYSGVNRNTGAQADVVIWTHNSVKNTIITAAKE